MTRALTGTGALLIAVVLLTGCTAKAPTADSAPSPTPSPSETAATLPAVSLNTTCNQLFGSNVDGPIARSTDIVTRFVAAPDLSTITEDELSSTIESLDAAAKNADPAVQPYIDAQTDVLQQLLNAMANNENSNVDFADYKASGLELVNQCEPYL